MSTRPNSLPIPTAAIQSKERADEVLRVWIVDRRELATTFPPEPYGEDVWKWGRLLANIARYVAEARARETGSSREDSLSAIAVNFDEEVRQARAMGTVMATRERDQS
jgi:hypothetical protein